MTRSDGLSTTFPLFVPSGRTLNTGKSIVAFGDVGGMPAVAKRSAHGGREWRDRFRHEIRVYQRLQAGGYADVAPQLLFADSKTLVLVISRAPGRPLSDTRHPRRDIGGGTADTVIAAIAKVGTWRPWRIPSLRKVFERHEDRVERYRNGEWMRERTAEWCIEGIHRLFAKGLRPVFAHGDLIGPNTLLGEGCTLIDWEFSNYHLPHYDLALLWTVGRRQPTMRERILATVAAGTRDRQLAFAVNLATLLARERKIHEALPDDDPCRVRLAGIDADLSVADGLAFVSA